MNKIAIQIIGRDKEQLQIVLNLINGNEQWSGTIASTDEEAIEQFQRYDFEVVVLTNGLNEEEVRKLKKIFTIQQENIIILEHFGLDHSTLTNEITQALKKYRDANKPGISMVDDALKNAGLNIKIQ